MRTAFALLALISTVPAPALAAPGDRPFIPVGAQADGPEGFDEMCARDSAACRAMAPRPQSFAQPVRQANPAAPVWATGAIEREPRLLQASCTAPGFGSDFACAPRGAARPAPAAAVHGNSGGSTLSNAHFALVNAVNQKVNRITVQLSDDQRLGIAEYWERPRAGKRLAGDCEDIAIEKRMRLIEAGIPADSLSFAVVFHRRRGLHTVLVAHMESGDYALDSLSSKVQRWDKTEYTWLRLQSRDNLFAWNRITPGAARVD